MDEQLAGGIVAARQSSFSTRALENETLNSASTRALENETLNSASTRALENETLKSASTSALENETLKSEPQTLFPEPRTLFYFFLLSEAGRTRRGAGRGIGEQNPEFRTSNPKP